MPRLMSTVIALALALTAFSAANAQVYKWKDANGTTHFSDQPPVVGAKFEEVQVNGRLSAPVTASTATPAGASTTASATAAAKSGPVADTPDNRTKLCANLGKNITLLNSQQPLTIGISGVQKSMSEDQRHQELATAQAQQKLYCAAGK